MKTKLIISLMAVLAFYSCQSEIIEEKNHHSYEAKVFSAIIEDGFSDTKTSIDEKGNVLWKKGDQISIFDGVTINKQYKVSDASDGKTTADLILVSPSGFVAGNEIDNNVAFYPYQSTTTITKNEGNYVLQDIELPSKQTYAENSFGNGTFPMVAVSTSTADKFLKFKNVLGAVKLQLKGTASIASIKITGNNNEILYGPATIDISSEFTPSINLTNASAKTVTLNCGGVQLNNTTATSFVIALPPMTMSRGFTVVVKDSEEKEMEIKTDKSQTIKRSDILKMPVVTYEGKQPEKEQTPLTFTSTGETSLLFRKYGSPYSISLEYKLNDGDWVSYSIGDEIPLNDKDQVSFRAGSTGNSKFSQYTSAYYTFKISGTGSVAASGNIMSLIDQKMATLTIPNSYYFTKLFENCTALTSAPELPATTLASCCYHSMFSGCTALTSAPELPATTLASFCYTSMFSGCSALTTAPELPATTLASYCYQYMFNGCTSLINAPELSASTLADFCYQAMFLYCTALTNAPELPATKLAESCYSGMFSFCTSLTATPELPATTLTKNCYEEMFSCCTALTNAPELPASKLVSNCYSGMFLGCTALTNAPELPASTLAINCYKSMFYGCTALSTAPKLIGKNLAADCYENMFSSCTALTNAPELPATILETKCYKSMFSYCSSLTTVAELPAIYLGEYCYDGMFEGCSSLVAAPKLPATNLEKGCYQNMFLYCTALTNAPELPATTLVERCYNNMFSYCYNLNYVKALFTTTPSSSYTQGWLYWTSSTGTFVKSKDATWDVTGATGIPEGWTVQTE